MSALIKISLSYSAHYHSVKYSELLKNGCCGSINLFKIKNYSMNINFLPLPTDGLDNATWGLTCWHGFEAVIIIHNNSLIGLGFTSAAHEPQDLLRHFIKCLKLKNLNHNDQQINTFMTSWTNDDMPIIAFGTSFQHQVWQSLLTIAHNKTLSYRDISTKINRPTAYRAVGQAVGRNPIAGIIPCHRVIATSGKMGGFRWGVDVKQQLLKKESDQV